jgi:hypothetical protein
MGHIGVPPTKYALVIAERKAWSKLEASMTLNAVELLFITKASVEQALSRPMAYLDSAMFIFTHETISAPL